MKIFGKSTFLNIFASLAVFSPLLNAATLYNESISGDSTGGELVYLINGDNLFLGSQAFSDAVDGIRFVVASGSHATIQFNYSYSNLSGSDAMASLWALYSFPQGAGSCSAPANSPLSCIVAGHPDAYYLGLSYLVAPDPNNDFKYDTENGLITFILSSGVYQLNDNGAQINSLSARSGVLNYTFNIKQEAGEVPPIVPAPIPTAGLLYGSSFLIFLRNLRTRLLKYKTVQR